MEVVQIVVAALSTDPRVVLFESDIATGHTFIDGLGRAGMQVAWARDPAEGLALKARLMPEIALIGLGADNDDSLSLVGQVIDQRDCGVIVLAGWADEAARVASLERGADDYLPTPLVAWDMVARIRAVHRRLAERTKGPVKDTSGSTLTFGPIRINLQHRSVHTLDGRRLTLTSAEYSALEALARAGGKAVSRDALSEAALRRPWRAEDRSVDQLVFNLRQKLPADTAGGLLIQSIRGSGYWMRAPDQAAGRRPDYSWLLDATPARGAHAQSAAEVQAA